jgi:tetratricopeptide (TPR) repeat protein
MKDSDLQKMIKYLGDEMSNQEKQLFEQEIAATRSLTKLQNLMEEIEDTVSDDQLFELVDKLKETQDLYNEVIGITYVVEKEKQIRINWRQIAAAVVTLMLIVTTLIFNFSRSANVRIYDSYYKQYKGDMVGSRSSGSVNPMINAVQLYDKGEFNAAISMFGKILSRDATNTTAHFFMGISYMELHNYLNAIKNLSYVIDNKDIAFTSHAKWYLALCYLETGQNSKSAAVLSTLIDTNNVYKIKAQDLLKKIQ